jgi:hypothetical protein
MNEWKEGVAHMESTQIWSAQHIRDFAQRKWRALSAELNIRQDGTPLRTVAHEMDRKIPIEIPRAVRAAPIDDVGTPTKGPICRTKPQP